MKQLWCVCIFFSTIYLGKAETKMKPVAIVGELDKVMTFTLNESTQYFIEFEESTSIYPYRIRAWTIHGNPMYPVLVVVTQEKEITSWKVPFTLDTVKGVPLIFENTSKTLCHNNMDDINKVNPLKLYSKNKFNILKNLSQKFRMALMTSSKSQRTIYVEASQETNFYVRDGELNTLNISPSETRFVFYKFQMNATDTVIINIDSPDDVCLTVSVQDSSCPVFDENEDVMYSGKYQTIDRKGALTVRRQWYPNGFFLVFVAKPDNHDCLQENSILPVPSRRKYVHANVTSTVTFTIKKDMNRPHLMLALILTVTGIFIFIAFGIIMLFVFHKWGSISKLPKLFNGVILNHDEEGLNKKTKECVGKSNINVHDLARSPQKDLRRSFNYTWHILSIAIFYSIPVVQLVFTYQRMVNKTGNEDMCYYNFLCAHPMFGLSDFNHIFSNIGYVLIGVWFLLVSVLRQRSVPCGLTTGIPVHYGLFYSMGIALIIEGLLSACYHICPSQSNYQFDTSFMYVMAVLCMIKLYQNRHPDINATAYATFTVLGCAIFLAMLGILNGNFVVWILFSVVYSFLVIYISCKIYYLSYVIDGFKMFKEEVRKEGITSHAFAPVRRGRFILLLVANLINFSILITMLVLYDSQLTDFATFLLGLLMANSVLYAAVYTIMKLVVKERICWEAAFYGIAAILSWGFATWFFLDAATLWTVTPAQSRQKNQNCILLGFYDKHDVWHLLSAPALYFSFMFLMCLDDDLLSTPQQNIKSF